MSETPAYNASHIPSLAKAFEPERAILQAALSGDVSSAHMVSAARRALDATGARYSDATDDVHLQRAGLWLLEMVKSSAGVLDNTAVATVRWNEVAKRPVHQWAGRGLFYGAAGIFALAGFVQGSGLIVLTAGVLAALRFFDPKDWGHWARKLPFMTRPAAITDETGRKLLASAEVRPDGPRFIDMLTEALHTADHILLRLAAPASETHWRDNPRLMGVVQSLLEAQMADDGEFALRLVKSELSGVLAADGIEILSYSEQNAQFFDIMPAIDQSGLQMAAPALMMEGKLLRRGTVWKGEAG